MMHGEIKTTVQQTTLQTNGSRPTADVGRARDYYDEMLHIERATRHLKRGHESHRLLSNRLHQLRTETQSLLTARGRSATLSYAGRTQLIANASHAQLVRSWLNLRDTSRAEQRARRRAMRESTLGSWRGPWRSFVSPMSPLRNITGKGNTLCGVHAKLTARGLEGIPNVFLNAYLERLKRRLYDAKMPTPGDTRRWVSVEIECVLRGGRGGDLVLTQAIMAGNVARYVCLKSDGSLRRNPDDHNGQCIEVVVTAPIGEIEHAVSGTCKALETAGAYVNATCGIHVHLDMRNFDRVTAYSNLVAGQKVLRKLVPEHRVHNTYCKPVRKRGWPDRRQRSRNDRYKAINALAWQRHQTIEVRMFAGSVNATKINGYVKACCAIAYAKDPVKRAPATFKGWQKANPELVDKNLIDWARAEARSVQEADELARAQQPAPTAAF